MNFKRKSILLKFLAFIIFVFCLLNFKQSVESFNSNYDVPPGSGFTTDQRSAWTNDSGTNWQARHHERPSFRKPVREASQQISRSIQGYIEEIANCDPKHASQREIEVVHC